MNTRFTYYISLILLLISATVSAQYIQVNDNYSAQQLVEALVSNSCAQVSNVSVSGWDGGAGGNSYGYFTAGTSGFPFENGIVLSTGFAASAPGPNNSLLSEGSNAWGGDADLEAALDVNNTINATVLEFDFVPYTDHISFDYIFSSEQYLTSITSQNQCNYTDGFAFLLREAGSTAPYQNLAVVPGTDIPVKVNTVRGEGVCPAANEEYFGGFNGTNHPTNFNGQTVIMKAEADVIAGTTYHIKLVVADQGNNLYDSAIFLGGGSFNATTELGPDRTIASGNPVCEDTTFTLDASTPNATGYRWFENGSLIPGENGATYTGDSAGEYSVEVQLSLTCFSYGSITIEYTQNPPVIAHTLLQCDEDNDGLAVFNLLLANAVLTNGDPDLSVTYYATLNAAEAGTGPVANAGTYQNTVPNQELYARVVNQFGCYSVSTVTLATSANGLTNPAPLETCDTDGNDDGLYVFDLTQRTDDILQGLPPGLELLYFTSGTDALAAVNPITNPAAFANTIPNNQTVYARVYNGSECYGIAELELIVYSFGAALEDETVTLCAGSSVTLDAGSGYTSYIWNGNPLLDEQTLFALTPGTYTVTVTNIQGCEGNKTFTVIPSGIATGVVIDINDFAQGANSVTIQPEGPGDYEFSLDGIFYQDSPLFENLPSGQYTAYIKDRNGCGIYQETFFVLDYPAFFTPNGDGVNETWRIPFLFSRPDAVVTVFDRYGKQITGFKGNGAWDGTYNGRPLPSTDYWFTIQFGNGRIVKGHFSMLR